MNLIENLSSQLGIDTSKAEGLAGAALGFIQGQVADKVGGQEAAAVQSAIPEMDAWVDKAPSGEGSGGILGAAAGLMGGGDLGQLVSSASKLGLDAGAVQKALPLIVDFLKSRLDDQTLAKVLGALPFLKGGTGGGGLAGALGGFLT